MIVHNLAMGEMNCDRLFNLVCQYGNVSKIFFMKVRSILLLQFLILSSSCYADQTRVRHD